MISGKAKVGRVSKPADQERQKFKLTEKQSKYSYKAARGAIPWKPGDEPAEDSTARLRGRPNPPKSADGLRQAGAQAGASLPFVPSRPSSALALERELLIKAMALIKLALEINKQESETKNGY